MKKLGAGVLLALVLVTGSVLAQQKGKADVELQAAIRKEAIDGDLNAAIKLYEAVVSKYKTDHAVAAQALLHLASCYEKLGDARSRKILEQVVRDYTDQKDVVAMARARLGVADSASGSSPRLVERDGWVFGFSADGRYLLWGDEEGALKVRDQQTGQARQVAKLPVAAADISPDGRQIVLGRPVGDTSELRLVAADGSGDRLLWTGLKGTLPWFQWLPDGKRLGMVVKTDSGVRLMALTVADGKTSTLWEGKELIDPVVSPDGKTVAYSRRVSENPKTDDLWALNLADGTELRLLQGQAVAQYPQWTPDGSGIVYLSDSRLRGTTDLWFLRMSGGKPVGSPQLLRTNLAEAGGYAEGLGPITKSGGYYFYRQGPYNAGQVMQQLFTVGFDPASGKVVGEPAFLSKRGGIVASPSFSQDGRLLAYVWGPGPTHDDMRVIIRTTATGEERMIPIDPALGALKWVWMSPSGRSLAITVSRPDVNEIYQVDVASGAVTSLKKAGEGEVKGYPTAITPDDKTLIFTRYPSRESLLVSRNLETGKEQELFRTASTMVASLSPDGKQLAIIHREDKDVLLSLMPASGGALREIHRTPGNLTAGGVAWTPDGRNLLFGASDGPGTANIKAYFRVSVDGGPAEPIGIAVSTDERVQFPRALGLVAVQPNGKQLIYTANGAAGNDYGTFVLEHFLPKVSISK